MGYGAGETLGITGTGVVPIGETGVVGTIGAVVVSTGVDGMTGTGVVSTGTIGVVAGLRNSQYAVFNAAICSEGTKWSSTQRGWYRLAW